MTATGDDPDKGRSNAQGRSAAAGGDHNQDREADGRCAIVEQAFGRREVLDEVAPSSS